MSTFLTKEWHGKEVFCWYREEAKKQKGKTETFVEIEKGRITISELILDKKKPMVCAVFSSPYREEIVESSHMSEAFVVKKGKMVGSADSMQGILASLLQFMSQELKKDYKHVYLLPPSGTFFYKIINFPQMPEADLKSALKNEIQLFEEGKLKEEASILRSWHLGQVERKEGLHENYLLVGVPKAGILNYIEILNDTKAALAGFTTPQLLYFYNFNQHAIEDKHSFIFVELTDYSLRISFFQNGILTFIRYSPIGKWTEKDKFIRSVSKEVQHSILYLNQQYPDASLDKFVLFNRTSVSNVAEEISKELEFKIDNFDAAALADYAGELWEKMEEYHISLASPLYSASLSLKNEAIALPLRDFDTRIQNKIRFQAAALFLVCWTLVLLLGIWQIRKLVTDQETILKQTEDTSQKELLLEEQQRKAARQQTIYSNRYVHVKNFLKLKSRWMQLFYGLIKAKTNDIAFTKMTLQPYVAQQGEDDSLQLLGHSQVEMELKIFQNYQDALKSFENLKAKLAEYYEILAQKEVGIDAKEGMTFGLTIKLKKDQQQ